MIPTSLPHGRTARRLEWVHLPPAVRSLVERRCGAPVTDAASRTAGFTPGFASVLTCADGSRHFVKAASVKAQRVFAESYRVEARKLAALPPEVPAPRLLWVHDDDDWVVLGIEHVEARHPARPWRADDLDAALAMTGRIAEVLTPAPAGLALEPVEVELAGWPALWERVAEVRPGLPHLDDAAALAGRFAEVAAGDTVVHSDIRDDNVLLLADGSALVCDWNWPMLGAAWLDTLWLLLGPRGDGLDADAVLATHPLTRDVPADHVDVVLALLAGYYLKSGADPAPPTSPYVRQVQQWHGLVCWDWLAERRGWATG
ncbi:phosphotransferase [Nocardioides sp. TF02-7]|uniref:phosphotransferase family protein n=1 Tax=Nocardioides sp. TF02-7 TaxID=2917724 RepID=UPI001F06DE6F|nr:phosphotransferase [Nocardioides sp. TF02-7]UMG92928.1 phosphotransferase [Nocardioides sp. TF02-7]